MDDQVHPVERRAQRLAVGDVRLDEGRPGGRHQVGARPGRRPAPAPRRPRTASRRQIALPMKPPAPVTAALRPSKRWPPTVARAYTRRALLRSRRTGGSTAIPLRALSSRPGRRRRRRSSPVLRTAVRAAAGLALAGSVAVPLVRRRLRVPPPSRSPRPRRAPSRSRCCFPAPRRETPLCSASRCGRSRSFTSCPTTIPSGCGGGFGFAIRSRSTGRSAWASSPTSAFSAPSPAPARSPRWTACWPWSTGPGSSSRTWRWPGSWPTARRGSREPPGRWRPPTTWGARSTSPSRPRRRGGPPSRDTSRRSSVRAAPRRRRRACAPAAAASRRSCGG